MVDWNSGKILLQEGTVKEECIKVLALGDIMLLDRVQQVLKEHSGSYPYENVSELFSGQDYIFCNLEAMIKDEKNIKIPGKRATFEIEPDTLNGLIDVGVNIFNVGNNHSVDFGPHQVVKTIKYLHTKNVHAIGGGENKVTGRKPLILNSAPVKIGLLAYAKEDTELNATSERPGNNGFILDEVVADVQALRKDVDIIIVSVHWGWEFVNYPSPNIQSAFRTVIDSGADLILGHHPHFINGVEFYKDKAIFYSLGSFLIEYEPHLSEYEYNLFKESYKNNIAVQIYLNQNGIASFKIIPIFMTKDMRVGLADAREKGITLQLMKKYSDPLNDNELEKVFWKNSRNHLMIQFPAYKRALKINGFFALEHILSWLAKPEIIKMLSGNFVKIIFPDFLTYIITRINYICYKVLHKINVLRKRRGKHPKEIFE